MLFAITPQKFNIEPEKWWLEDYFPIDVKLWGGISWIFVQLAQMDPNRDCELFFRSIGKPEDLRPCLVMLNYFTIH